MFSKSNQDTFPSANAALALLILINLFNYIDRQVLAAVVGPIKKTFFEAGGKNLVGSDTLVALIQWSQNRLGFTPDDALLGLLGTAFMLVYMLGAPIFARMAERWSRWAIVSIGVILWSLASGASGLANTFFILLITRCFVGIGEAAYGPVAPAMISDLFPLEARGRAMAWFYTAIPVGSALGYVLGGFVANSEIGRWGAGWFGMGPDSWRWAFLIVLAPGIILGARSSFMRDSRKGEPESGRRPAGSADIHLRDYLILIRTPSYMFCTFGMAAMTFAIGGIAFWMPYYLASRPNAPSNATIIFGAITATAGLIATLLGGIAGDKLRARFSGSYFLVSGIAMLIGFPIFIAVLHAPFPWAIWVLIFLASFCLFFNTGPTNTILANVTHPSIRAAGFALNILIIHAFGDVISPVIVGLLNDWCGDMNKSFLVVGFMFLIAGALWLIGARYLQHDMDQVAERWNRRPGY
jgi:MFS transporter, Spinster family, sphingosine-1-phosphate transporter